MGISSVFQLAAGVLVDADVDNALNSLVRFEQGFEGGFVIVPSAVAGEDDSIRRLGHGGSSAAVGVSRAV